MSLYNIFSENLKQKLVMQSQFFVTIVLGIAAFSTYSCMYAFRKPFTVSLYYDVFLWEMNYKVVLVLAQLIGYTIAKGLGIKIISEITAADRPKYIIGMVLFAHLSLLLFALVPAPDNWPFMVLNGLGLGMVYGIVFSYLEGRKITEILCAFLIISFIVSSGFMKTIGNLLIINNINENWMPFCVGLIFLPIFLISVYALTLMPEPTPADEQNRTKRQPMNTSQRKTFLNKYGIGLFCIISVYILMTIFRDLRDNFSAEIWSELGENNSAIYTKTELIIGLVIALNIALGYRIKNNRLAFYTNHFFIILGCCIIFISTHSFLNHLTSPFWWMTLSGLGIYMAYIPFNGVLFDRLLAVLKEKANVGFLFYLSDFTGYLGSIAVMLYQNYAGITHSWLGLVTNLALWLPLVSIVFVLFSFLFFAEKINSKTSNHRKLNFKRNHIKYTLN